MTRPCHLHSPLWPCATLVALCACADRPPVAPTNRALSFDAQSGCVATDPEVFGYVYINGVPSERADLKITIYAADPETRSRLRDPFPQTMWVSPNIDGYPRYPLGRSFGWYDPRAGCECGGIDAYLSGDTANRAREVHWASLTNPDTAGPERHCIVPGRYHIALEGGGVTREFDLEYVGVRALAPGERPARDVPDSDLGGTLLIEPHDYTPYDTYSDHTVNFDLAAPRSRTAQAVLRLQATYSNPDTSAFVPEPAQPAITERTCSLQRAPALGTQLAWPAARLRPCSRPVHLGLRESGCAAPLLRGRQQRRAPDEGSPVQPRA